MYSTDVFHFGTAKNGYLISLNSLVRGLFLTLVFPRLIASGRRWFSRRASKYSSVSTLQSSPASESHVEATNFGTVTMDEEEEPVERANKKETFAFDLWYTRYSLMADAALTGIATFTSQGWQMYVIAVLLPFASGTGAAAKGTILQMCSPDERIDALSAITRKQKSLIVRLYPASKFTPKSTLFYNFKRESANKIH